MARNGLQREEHRRPRITGLADIDRARVLAFLDWLQAERAQPELGCPPRRKTISIAPSRS